MSHPSYTIMTIKKRLDNIMKEAEQAYETWASANEGRTPFFSLKMIFTLAYQIGYTQGLRKALEGFKSYDQ